MARLANEQRKNLLERFGNGENIDDLVTEFELSRHQRYDLQNREQRNAKARDRVTNNRELHNARTLASKRKNWNEYLERNRISNQKSRALIKAKAIAALGGKCVRCGYDDNIFALQIDHINGDGSQDRKSRNNNQWSLYKDIVNFNMRDKYQVLCANCNQIKRMENREHPPGKSRK